MTEGALADVVVLELATGVAGPYCGRLFADLGAQVIRVEPTDGDSLRQSPPLKGGESAFFNWLNADKLSAASQSLDAIAGHADIILHDARGPEAAALDARLTALNPRAVVISLTPYGRSGPRMRWQASELTEWATAGYGYIAGDPDREPLALHGHQAELHAGLHAAVGALGALWHARNTGEGQRIEVSHQEATLSDHAWLTTLWTHQGVVQQRTGSLYVPCADGFAYLFNLVPYPNLFLLMERFDLLEDESLLVPATWWARFPEILAAFAEWARTQTKQEIYHAAQELRIAVSPVNDMADVAANPQLIAREWFGEIEVASERFKAPGFPYRLTGTPCTNSGHAAALGEHDALLSSPDFAWANAAVPTPSRLPISGELPLAGIRVIEVTANWAGPIGGRHLADLGADVIKVELASKPATRALAQVADDLWPEHYHRSGYFNKLNRNKRAICLDLSKPEGKELFKRLVAVSDVVLENNAARVMNNLGLGYEALAEVHPGLIMCSMAGYGATGPDRNYSAYGSNIETSSGLASVLGYGPGEFFGTGTFYADPVTGNHGAVAILAALHARRRSGRGQWIDISLLEAVTPFFAQPFLEHVLSGTVPAPVGNRSPEYAPQGYYPTIGRDCWLALTVRDGRDWLALCTVMDRADLAADAVLGTLAGRQRHHDLIDHAIRSWAATLDHNHAAAALQARGVSAAPVMQNWEICSDNHLNGRGFFVPIAHPEAGTHAWPGFPWRLSATPGRVFAHAPLFAEHNAAVFSGLLGLSATEIAALYEAGVTSDAPVFGGPIL